MRGPKAWPQSLVHALQKGPLAKEARETKRQLMTCTEKGYLYLPKGVICSNLHKC